MLTRYSRPVITYRKLIKKLEISLISLPNPLLKHISRSPLHPGYSGKHHRTTHWLGWQWFIEMGHPVIALSCGYWPGWDYITMIKLRTWPSEIKAAMQDPVHSLNASSKRSSEGSDYRGAAHYCSDGTLRRTLLFIKRCKLWQLRKCVNNEDGHIIVRW